MTDKSGAKLQGYLYRPYGETWITETATITDITRLFSGQQYDQESGLYYMNARYYDPSIGIFMTPDPAMSDLNHYAYANCNPVKFNDPSGRWSKEDAINAGMILTFIFLGPIAGLIADSQVRGYNPFYGIGNAPSQEDLAKERANNNYSSNFGVSFTTELNLFFNPYFAIGATSELVGKISKNERLTAVGIYLMCTYGVGTNSSTNPGLSFAEYLQKTTWGFINQLVGDFGAIGNILFNPEFKGVERFEDTTVVKVGNKWGGITFGSTIFTDENYGGWGKENMLNHERGHYLQNLALGPFYLLVVGIPSLVSASYASSNREYNHHSFYTEMWADLWGGVYDYYEELVGHSPYRE